MYITVKKINNTLVPVYDSDLETMGKLKEGEVYSGNFKFARNYQFHKKFMALCKLGYENSKSVNMPHKSYYKYAVMKAGYFETYQTPKGIMVLPKSIAFENMEEDEFREVYDRVLQFIADDIQADKHTIENELLSFM